MAQPSTPSLRITKLDGESHVDGHITRIATAESNRGTDAAAAGM